MVDIHSHILPGIDDGSVSMDQSLIMAEMAVESGTTVIAATSHSNQIGRFENFESREYRGLYRAFTAALKEEGIPLQVARGMEIFTFDSEDTVEKIRSRKLISLNKSNNYLIEFAFDENPWTIESILREMLDAGYQPIIAHPERYYCIQDNPNYLYEWRRMGAYAQMNKGSVTGRFGYECAKTAELILSHRMINCAASDTHSHEYRTPDLRETLSYLEKHYSSETARLLLEVNPTRILMNRRILEPEPPMPVERRRWY